jgi:inner membrane protein involved in colicin E2 resistance
MAFRFYSNAVSQATRGIATGMLVVGLLLVGFGMLILAMPEVFAFLAACIFFIAGSGCALTAIKIYFAQRAMDRTQPPDGPVYRSNVRIHTRSGFDG